MGIIPLYHHKIEQAERAGIPLQFDELPRELRTQIVMVLEDALGVKGDPWNENASPWPVLTRRLQLETGRRPLCPTGRARRIPREEYLEFLEQAKVPYALSAIQLACDALARAASWSEHERWRWGITLDPVAAIEEVNDRLRLAGCGFQYQDGEIVRVDSEVMHDQVVAPAIMLLRDSRFSGANDEYLSALRKLRDGDMAGAIVEANNAFESALKSICAIHGWTPPNGATAKQLLSTVRSNGLFGADLETVFEQLLATLKGLPDLRNNNGGHGQGPTPRPIPRHLGTYAVHMAGSKIVMLCSASRALEEAREGQPPTVA